MSFVEAPPRARGFYSHPLTLAYAAFLVWPLALYHVLQSPRSWLAWGIFSGPMLAILFSHSRTVQAVALLVAFVGILWATVGKTRRIFLMAATLALVVVATTNNPIRDKFSKTMAGNFDVRSGYVDDRVAYWHAHWEMWKDRPLLGHGVGLDTAYRTPYYERLGLGEFERRYEAHNMLIQASVNGGLVGLGFLLAWFLRFCGSPIGLPYSPVHGKDLLGAWDF